MWALFFGRYFAHCVRSAFDLEGTAGLGLSALLDHPLHFVGVTRGSDQEPLTGGVLQLKTTTIFRHFGQDTDTVLYSDQFNALVLEMHQGDRGDASDRDGHVITGLGGCDSSAVDREGLGRSDASDCNQGSCEGEGKSFVHDNLLWLHGNRFH
ncbi:MAG: hypothetical protein COZ86_01840 [Candidatus Moranbacteria bacterium CG_4_8_14_3_um_filter_41_13]|nr:MAG: hypothetical protein COZ86_01840 [Candidatus Moranbacteria bacterium CG_4_8_14_3_um_filter_41_13]PJC00471.1 MAG: hypothetical protein CO075_00495 [Candidatus Moranbacteria bacterium CG_4_9_14_0_8_um_filter_41_43]HCJ45806.1 hypothetical protein [Candidatus Moranbacteria bacterium]